MNFSLVKLSCVPQVSFPQILKSVCRCACGLSQGPAPHLHSGCVHACVCICVYVCACVYVCIHVCASCTCVCIVYVCECVCACIVHACTCVRVWPHPSSESTCRGQNRSTAGHCPPLLFSSSGDLFVSTHNVGITGMGTHVQPFM